MAKPTSSGSITQLEKDKPKNKCRKWQLRVPVGVNPRTGKYKIKTRRFNGTWTEAKRALREFVIEIENDQVHQRAGTTVEACAESFMERRRASGEFTENTNELYDSFFKAICLHIGKADASQVDREVVEGMWADMRAGDTLSGRPASGTYVHQLHKTLKLLFDDLVVDGIVDRNPCLDLETPQRDTEERRALKSDRMRSFVGELDAEEEEDAAYLIAVTMGLRGGEICALSWDDVDFDAGVLCVAHNFDRFGNLKVMQQLAGHASSKTTMDIYTHVNMAVKRAAADVTEDVFSRQGAEEKAAKRAATDLAAKRGADNIIVFGDFQRRKRGSTAPVQTPGRIEPDSNHPDCHEPFMPPNTQVDQQVS